MIYTANDDGVHITGVMDFDPVKIFECGQCFRWNAQADGSYTGVAKGTAARVSAADGIIKISGSLSDFENIWRDYFDLDRDYTAIRNAVAVDAHMRAASEFGRGIRILRQDAWEALCSFIISQCNNISRIKGIVERLCTLFGDRLSFEGVEYYTFPGAKTIAGLSPADLQPLRAGYRAPYIIEAAKAVESGALDLEALVHMDAAAALKELTALNGVGVKVAGCIILFGLHKLEAFPIDVWMKRAICEHYPDGLDPDIFGGFAGVAQQYMFYFARERG